MHSFIRLYGRHSSTAFAFSVIPNTLYPPTMGNRHSQPPPLSLTQLPTEILFVICKQLFVERTRSPVVQSLLNLRQSCQDFKVILSSDGLGFWPWFCYDFRYHVNAINCGSSLSSSNIPSEDRVPELCLIALKNRADQFPCVPASVIRGMPNFYQAAVAANGGVLEYVPHEAQTYEMCLAAVAADGMNLKFIPKINRSPEICLVAVIRDELCFDYVPEIHRTPELCSAAVISGFLPPELFDSSPELRRAKEELNRCHRSRRTDSILECIPVILRTPAVCLAAVNRHGFNLKFVPEPLLTPNLCLAAVKHKGGALQFVPDPMRSLEICSIALRSDPKKCFSICSTCSS